jgi:hypothetical protein
MIALAALAMLADPVWVGRFEGMGEPPPPWRVVRLNRRVKPTHYRLATIGGVAAVEAVSEDSMALLARPIRVDLAATPILCWRWRIDAPIAKADMRRKSADDYAARVYVAFDLPDKAMSAGTRMKLAIGRRLFGADLPDAAVTYVWDNRNPVGTARRSAYTDRAQLIVAESGVTNAGRWVRERQDVAAHFTAAFGAVPAKPIQLAIASDTDNTKSRARAAFADIHFVERGSSCRA